VRVKIQRLSANYSPTVTLGPVALSNCAEWLNALDEISRIFFEKSAGVAELHRVFLIKIF
jgi:hypothetical protein